MSSIKFLKKILKVGLSTLAILAVAINLLSAVGKDNINAYYFKQTVV